MYKKSTFRKGANNFLSHTKKNNGITLVALIITIIVILILVTVSVSALVNSNILEEAKNASQKTTASAQDESELGKKININEQEYSSIEEYLGESKKPKIPDIYVTAGKYKNIQMQFTGHLNGDSYNDLQIKKYGIVYMESTKLDGRELDVNTPGRTSIIINTIKEDGTFSYNFTTTNTIEYTSRAYFTYLDDDGKTEVYVYSEPITAKMSSL